MSASTHTFEIQNDSLKEILPCFVRATTESTQSNSTISGNAAFSIKFCGIGFTLGGGKSKGKGNTTAENKTEGLANDPVIPAGHKVRVEMKGQHKLTHVMVGKKKGLAGENGGMIIQDETERIVFEEGEKPGAIDCCFFKIKKSKPYDSAEIEVKEESADDGTSKGSKNTINGGNNNKNCQIVNGDNAQFGNMSFGSSELLRR